MNNGNVESLDDADLTDSDHDSEYLINENDCVEMDDCFYDIVLGRIDPDNSMNTVIARVAKYPPFDSVPRFVKYSDNQELKEVGVVKPLRSLTTVPPVKSEAVLAPEAPYVPNRQVQISPTVEYVQSAPISHSNVSIKDIPSLSNSNHGSSNYMGSSNIASNHAPPALNVPMRPAITLSPSKKPPFTGNGAPNNQIEQRPSEQRPPVMSYRPPTVDIRPPEVHRPPQSSPPKKDDDIRLPQPPPLPILVHRPRGRPPLFRKRKVILFFIKVNNCRLTKTVKVRTNLTIVEMMADQNDKLPRTLDMFHQCLLQCLLLQL